MRCNYLVSVWNQLWGTKSFFSLRSILHVILKVIPHTAHRRSLLSAARSTSIRRHLARSSTVHIESFDTMRSRKAQMSSTTGRPRNRRYISQWRNQKLRWRENRAPKRIQAGIHVYTSEADFHKPGIYGGSVRAWATTWDVFRRAPSRVGRGGRAAVDFIVCFGLGGVLPVFFSFLTRPFFAFRQRSLSTPGCVQGAII